MRGQVGSEINLTVRRKVEKRALEFKIIRKIIEVKSIEAKIIDNKKKIAYLKIKSFNEK
jgi:carboxyl-terminal processing protease